MIPNIPAENIFTWDHHVSGFRELEGIPNYFFDDTKSASLIFYEWIQKDQRIRRLIKEYIILCDAYDMWRIEDPLFTKAKQLNYALMGTKNWDTEDPLEMYKYFIDMQLKKFANLDNESFFLTRYEAEKVAQAEKKEKEKLALAKKNLEIREDSLGRPYGFTKFDSKISVVSSLLLKERLDIQYLVVYNTFFKIKDENKISIRSRKGEGIDVSKIAESYDGGGHLEAAAFSFKTKDALMEFASGKKHLA
jgi:oligoribonuclease NrnB/cAMP/cGMP phosphodiesterase (DHH superfamily)